MEVKLIMKSARNAVIEIADGGIYNTKETYHVLLNGDIFNGYGYKFIV